MGHPRWELAGRETGRGIYHRRWDIQDGNWQVGDGKRNLPHDMGLPRARLEDFDPAPGEGNPDIKLWRNRGNTTGSTGKPITGGTQRENEKNTC